MSLTLPPASSACFVGQPQQHVAMAWQGSAPADQIKPTQLGQGRHQPRLRTEPALIGGNGKLMLGWIAMPARAKRVRPFAPRQPIPAVRSPDVDRAGRDDRLLFAKARQMADVEDMRHRLRVPEWGG